MAVDNNQADFDAFSNNSEFGTMNHFQLVICFLTFSFGTEIIHGQIRLASPFGDNMVLQRNEANPIWGWSEPGDKVTVVAQDQRTTTTTDTNGRWSVQLAPMQIGKSFSIVVTGPSNKIELKNVVVGEVWICSGQSNMEWTVNRSGNPEQERKNASYPLIRHIKVSRETAMSPQLECNTTGWQICTPETVGEFTAVGYYFGRQLHQDLKVPIGLVNTSWGGTIVEAWTSSDSLGAHPDFADRIQAIVDIEKNLDVAMKRFEKDITTWQEKYDTAIAKSDQQSSGDIDDTNWQDINAPGQWEKQGYRNYDGVAWYRKKIKLPENHVGKELSLSLAMIDDNDRTFVNGQKIGQSNGWQTPRRYTIPADVNDKAEMTISIQVHDTSGGGGIHGDPDQLQLTAQGFAPIALAGKWRFKKSKLLANLPPRPKAPGFSGPNNPTALYNAMVHPLVPLAFKGVIWYQGESNASRAYQYRTLFPLLIKDWRSKWDREFPFYWVQLANFRRANEQPVESDWAELREAQSKALQLPATGEAVIIDIGNARDIHPKNKQDVGKRLALHAMKKNYGMNVMHSGPRYQTASVEGERIRLTFKHSSGLKSTNDSPLKQFQIAGTDKKFAWANANIDGNDVVVWADTVKNPVAVRYAWADNPEGCNLTNSSGLPASPFRTDSWDGVTVGKK